jgi:orotidine-5'-phosphate decarboxylase
VVEDYSHSLVEELVKLSEELEFMIFEDRKFADIGEWKLRQAMFLDRSSLPSRYLFVPYV